MGFIGRKAKKKGASKAPRELSFSDRIKAFRSGNLLCQQCRHLIPLIDLEPLQLGPCPKCGSISFFPLRISHFWLFEPLGGGGMGSVYKALSTEWVNRLFAVKVLAREEKTRPAPIQALLNEARTGKIIGNHPCLVRCVASGYQDGEYFAAMECVTGERLDKWIDLMGRLPEKEVLNIALHVLSAEQHIYNCGYLYRDLKPENIIVNKAGLAVLLDYGLCQPRAKALNPADEFVAGSPYYLPPERLLGLGEDAYSEIYSLGMVMYYALSGQTFFDAEEVEALAKRHVSKMRISVSSKMRGFRPELVEVLSTMINKEGPQRYQTYADVAAAIRKIQT